jgi:hypothetical protein
MKKFVLIGVSALTVSGLIWACGTSSSTTKTTEKTATLTFTADIDPIIKESCATSGCHGTTGALSTVYVGKESAFKASKTESIKRLGSGDMPRSPGTISATNKQKLVDFLNQ